MVKLREMIRDMRTDYISFELDEKTIGKNPFRQFEKWMAQAMESEVEEPNAMTLATVSKKGQPDARVVLLRDLDP
ncbi:MAG TPA: pyridoxamine 5'-phosphate oxidase family protein, partial [Bacteroidia bacterium]|nr:pyridoxamine 5'-phosphate oxidase family protein [Bacteroidia bacterium]